MTLAQSATHKSHMRGVLYVLNFLLNITFAITSYYLSSFALSVGVAESALGLLFGVGSVVGLLTLIFLGGILDRFGSYHAITIVGILYSIALILMGFSETVIPLIILYLLSAFTTTIILFVLDLFVERNTEKEEETGKVRSFFLTTANIAFTSGPFIGGLLIDGGNFLRLYLIAGLIFMPFLLLTTIAFSGERRLYRKREHHTVSEIFESFRLVFTVKKLKNIFFTRLILFTFYAVMVIYTPLYLHTHIGISFETLGIMFSIALLPFMIFEIPTAYLAKNFFGEKSLLIIGLAIMGFTTIVFAFLPTTSTIFAWTSILFLTRLGASIIEITSESLFFKQVDAEDVKQISAFRALYPIAYIVTPLTASAVLYFGSFTFLFTLLGFIILIGIIPASEIKDN